eukprot:EG_transcript_23486
MNWYNFMFVSSAALFNSCSCFVISLTATYCDFCDASMRSILALKSASGASMRFAMGGEMARFSKTEEIISSEEGVVWRAEIQLVVNRGLRRTTGTVGSFQPINIPTSITDTHTDKQRFGVGEPHALHDGIQPEFVRPREKPFQHPFH